MLEQKVKALIIKLKSENNDRANVMNSSECSDYAHTVLFHKYNNTLDIIKQLEGII